MLFLDTRRLPLLAAVCALLAAPPAAGAATRQVSPSGTDSGSCLTSPCRSLAYAYGQSASGDVVQVAAGAYPSQTVPGGTKSVTFRGANGAKLRQLDNAASNVVYDGLEVDGAFTKALAFHNSGDHSSFRNGRIGNVTDEKGALVSGTGFSFDNVVFHDVRVTDSSVHNECLYAIGVPGLSVRRSTFQNCATMDIFFTYGTWWSPLPPAYGDVTLENNVFGHTYKDDGTWHYYSLYVANTANGGGTVDGWVVRNNTFEIPANLEHAATGGSRWVGNLGSWECVSGMRYSHNVGKACGATDRAVARATSSAAVPAALGWIGGLNFRLTPASPAINAADPSDHPALDRDGYARTGRPDAGAHEFGAGPPRPGTGTPGNPTSPGKRRLVKSARLRPRTICRQRRRGCARSARLSLGVTERSRLAVRVVRVRGGKRVRILRLGLRKRPALRIRARGLKRGRYRVVVVATGATGLEAQARTFRLRVR